MKWYENDNKNGHIISSRIRIARNINKYPFCNFINKEQSKMLIKDIEKAIYSSSDNSKNIFKTIYFDNIDPIDCYIFLEEHTISQKFFDIKMPKALIMQNVGDINIMINEEDHIRIQSINNGYNIEKSYDEANYIDELLSENVEYAFHKKYGYLSSCITNVGTGLRASFMLHIPMLEKRGYISNIIKSMAKLGMTIRGVYGEGSKAYGSIYQISNQITLGKTDKDIIDELKNITNQIIEKELYLTSLIRDDINIIDSLYRSYGILSNCKKISLDEAIKHLSNIWLGINANIYEKESLSKLNIYNMMIDIQTACLKKKYNITKREDINIYRATYFNNILKI